MKKENKDQRITFRVTKKEKNIILKTAKSMSLSINECVRILLLNRIKFLKGRGTKSINT
jgi:hypothetical protein